MNPVPLLFKVFEKKQQELIQNDKGIQEDTLRKYIDKNFDNMYYTKNLQNFD